MENRLKERLTGAAILVALIVLVVPEMFRGHGAASAGGGATSGDGPPVRSYTIELGNAGARAAPMQITAAAPSSAAGSRAAATAVSAPERVGAVSPSPAPAVQTLQRPLATPASGPTPNAEAATPPSSAAPSQGSARARIVTVPSGWSVQLGLFAKSENAQRLAHTAQAKGFVARVSRSDSKGLYRVSVAGLADRTAAAQMSRRLRAAGLPAAVMRPR